MALTAGQRVASYEILEPIGEGGMGEVYRARDTQLGRDVALKVLPETLTAEPERLQRFEREAKLLAALNHPAIATLHGLERAEGKPVLVMELVEGETLAERIARAPLAPGEAVRLFSQIADALSAAHAKSIVHRDLKPANVKITPAGNIKVLDFGLAKLAEAEPDARASSASQSPTLTKNTALGAILGTASYMSPEQARGKQVDKRTDIWAFGCCLFEALSGRKAYDGETVADVLSKVLQLEPEWRALPTTTPPGTRRLVARCLEKDPNQRIHDIADARLELEESLNAPAIEPRKPSAHRALVPAIILAAFAGSLVTWLLTRPDNPPRPVQRFSINLPPGDQFIDGGVEGPLVTISRDGSNVVYAGVRDGVPQLFLRPIDATDATPIPGTEQGRGPFFSPDGRSIGFFVGREVKKVSLGGGPAGTIGQLRDPGTAGGTWSESRIVYGDRGHALWTTSDAAGETTELARVGSETHFGYAWPHLLPNGETVLYVTNPLEQSIASLSLVDGNVRTVVEDASFPRYLPTGHLLFVREDTVYAAPFDAERVELRGAPVPVLENVGRGGAGEAYFDVSDKGTLVYVSGQTKPETGLAWVDRRGQSRALGPKRRGTWTTPRLSPDGTLIAVAIEPQDSPPDLWLLETALATFTRVTSTRGKTPAWGTDSRNLFFTWVAVTRLDIEGDLEPELLEPGRCNILYAVSSDGDFALCDLMEAAHRDIGRVRLDGSGEVDTVVGSTFDEFGAALSPDERWLAYVSDESGRYEIYAQPFPGPGRKRQVSRDGGIEPAWSPDGRELFYRNNRDFYQIPFNADGAAGEAELLFSIDAGTSVGFDTANYDVSPDGQHFLMVQSVPSDIRPEIHVVINWNEELKRLVPVE